VLDGTASSPPPFAAHSTPLFTDDFAGGPSFKYIYDFADNWVHTVTLEQKVIKGRPLR